MVLSFTKLLLNERQSLSKIWLAAHYERKIKKNQVYALDIVKSVEDILNAEIFFDLRISGHLLVGIVKIHSRKCKYLLTECSDILYQVKLFRVGVIDLPDNFATARYKDITIPEVFENLDSIGNMMDTIMSSNQSRIEDITLKETHRSLRLLDDSDMMEFQFDESGFDDNFIKNYEEALSVFNESSAVGCIPMETDRLDEPQENEKLDDVTENRLPSEELNEQAPVIQLPGDENEIMHGDSPQLGVHDESIQEPRRNYSSSPILLNPDVNKLTLQAIKQVSSVKSLVKRRRVKRKLTIDSIKTLSYAVIKKQVTDTSDITSALELAPSTKRLMLLKEIGRSETLFRLPGQKILNFSLMRLHKRHLNSEKVEDDSLSFQEENEEQNSYNLRKKPKTASSEGCLEENLDLELSAVLPTTSQEEEPLQVHFSEAFQSALANDFNDFDMSSDRNVEAHSGFTLSYSDKIQDTQVSKTSDEKWEQAVQGRIFQLIQELRLLFKDYTTISFSTLVNGKRRFHVAQRFLCLLMLKKFQFVSLQQIQSFKDILIQPDVNFNCSLFSN